MTTLETTVSMSMLVLRKLSHKELIPEGHTSPEVKEQGLNPSLSGPRALLSAILFAGMPTE